MKNVAGEVKTAMAILPQVASGEATAINGLTVNRRGLESAILEVELGNASGSPTRFGVTFKVQEQSGESSWADVAGYSKTFSGETSVTQATRYQMAVDLRPLGTNIRAVATPTFTAGSSPKVQIAAIWVLGEAAVAPPA
jgi:hypothetical protein